MDMKMLGSSSHQYQFPALENTAISRPTRIPLYPYRPAEIAPLHTHTHTDTGTQANVRTHTVNENR